jgi:protein CpxP
MMRLTFLVIMLLLSMGIFAQPKKSAEERANMQTDRMTKELHLSVDQKNKIYQINLDANQQNDVIKASRMNEEAKKRSFHRNNETRNENIKAILTSDQVEIMEQKIRERKEMRKQIHREVKKELIEQERRKR